MHTRVLDAPDKATHMIAFLLDRTHDELSCTLEVVLLHVGVDTRRPATFPDDVATRLVAWTEAGASCGWPPPVGGAMGVRRTSAG